ncbi:MAG TPA: hypothetical protein IAC03_06300 [Candidatus Coprenecus pullistercoris]|nr:hypothetical protein [Candidatus Coprenecus pullistercoris]
MSTADLMGKEEKQLWQGTTDGSPMMLKRLTGLLRRVDVRLIYPFAACALPFYMLANPEGYRASYRLFHERLGRSRLRSFFNVLLNHYRFAQVIVDRFAMYAGRRFRVEVDGYSDFAALNEADGGFMILNSHVGSFELAGYTLRSERKRINALVYGEENETVMSGREGMFSRTNVRIVRMSHDLSCLIELSAALSSGEIVTMSADRYTPGTRTVHLPFLGKPAAFPVGPFALAASRQVPVLAIFVVKEAVKTYRILVRRLSPDGAGGKQALAGAFVAELEKVVRKFPEQWFNFYDFWRY